MSATLPNSNFMLNSAGDSHTFTYTRDKYGVQLAFGVFFLICIISGVSLLFTDLTTRLSWVGFFVLAVGLSVAFILAANRFLRKEGTFTVSSKEIVVDGQHYSREDIRRLTMVTPKGQAAKAKNVQGGTIIIGGPAIPVAAAVIGHQAVNVGTEMLDKIIQIIGDGVRDVNYKLTFQYGNKDIKLAGGMSEKNSLYLFDRLVDIMD